MQSSHIQYTVYIIHSIQYTDCIQQYTGVLLMSGCTEEMSTRTAVQQLSTL